MTKEAQAIINLIEHNKIKARKYGSLESTLELGYLHSLIEINEIQNDSDISLYFSVNSLTLH